jgi:hypothetical protein
MQGESFNNNPLSICSNETVQSRLGSEKVTEAERELWDKWTLDSNSFAIPDETENSKNATDTDSVPLHLASADPTQGLILVLNNDESDMSCPQFEGEGSRVSRSIYRMK